MHLPIGYHRFHQNKFINYQLNRWHSLGYSRKDDIEDIGSKIRTFKDYVSEFTLASKQAIQENRLKEASTYLRASEFLISPDDDRKIPTYNKFIQLFDQAFSDENFERHKVKYAEGFLSVIKVPSKTSEVKGTIIGCGGFDSFIEEFYRIWDFFAENGYDVIAYEGPGQGGSLREYGLPFDHNWEKPTSAVLDYFEIENVTALGISMGGYWIMRASAYEKRIKRVIAMPPVYDWLEMTSPINQKIAKWMLKHRRISNILVRLKMNVTILRHTINQALFIQHKKEPIDAIQWMLGMNKHHIGSHLIDQDVLLLGGENDSFQPPQLLRKQKEALGNARSITERCFVESEHAGQHCQIGNIDLVLNTMLDWINKKGRNPSQEQRPI